MTEGEVDLNSTTSIPVRVTQRTRIRIKVLAARRLTNMNVVMVEALEAGLDLQEQALEDAEE